MKKLLIITLGLFSAISFAEITNYDTSRYENLININVQNIITPKVVIFETDQNLDISKTILLDENKNPVKHSTHKNTTWTGDKISAKILNISQSTNSPENILDQNSSTFVDFSTQNIEHFIELSFPQNTKISRIYFANDANSMTPQQIKLENIINGQPQTIIAWKSYSSVLSFPEINTSQLKISVKTPHLWRLKDLEFSNKTRQKQTTTQLIFFAEEGKSYQFFNTAHFGAKTPNINNSQPLNIDEKTPKFQLDNIQPNTNFNPDFDLDGVIDSLDLCPKISDPNNTDQDNNGRGDICEDPDQDGLISSKDNCPFIYNPDQKNQDNDTFGDACDQENNQVSENYSKYFTSILFTLFAGILGFLIWRSYRKD